MSFAGQETCTRPCHLLLEAHCCCACQAHPGVPQCQQHLPALDEPEPPYLARYVQDKLLSQTISAPMQVDNEQASYQLSEAPHQVTTPSSTLGLVMPDHQLACKTSPIYAASEHLPWQAQQQERFSDLQGDIGSHLRAALALPLELKAPQGPFRAHATARPLATVSQLGWPSAHRRQIPQAVTTPPQPPSQSTHPHVGHSGQAQLHSLGLQCEPAHSIPVPSLQHYPTSLPQQGYSSRGCWVHPTGRRSVLQTDGQAHVPHSSLPASVDTAQLSRGGSQGLVRDPMHTPRPDVSHSSCSWSVPAQLQSLPYATPTPVCSSTAAPATSSWAMSHLRPDSLPLRHPIQPPHPSSYSEPPPKPPSQPQAPLHQTLHGNQGPNPSLPPRAPSQGPHPYPHVSHSFPGQDSSTVSASWPYSRCDHPSYAHLDLSRPLCLQQPPVSGHPATLGSYSRSSHVAEDPVCLQQSPVSGYPGSLESYFRSASSFVACDRPSLQQQPRSTVADAYHPLQQQLHEGSQQGLRRSGLMDLQAQQQGQGSALAVCHLEQLRRQTQPPSNTVDPATCTDARPQSSWTPMGVLLKPTLELSEQTKQTVTQH